MVSYAAYAMDLEKAHQTLEPIDEVTGILETDEVLQLAVYIEDTDSQHGLGSQYLGDHSRANLKAQMTLIQHLEPSK